MIISLGDYSEEVLKAMSEQVDLGLELVGQAAEGHAKDDCPVDTGLLRNSIAHAVAGEQPSIGESYKGTAKKQRTYKSNDGKKTGTYSNKTPKKGDEHSVYIGSNVEYAPAVELRDRTHAVGKAHFIRDAITQNVDEYKNLMELALKS